MLTEKKMGGGEFSPTVHPQNTPLILLQKNFETTCTDLKDSLQSVLQFQLQRTTLVDEALPVKSRIWYNQNYGCKKGLTRDLEQVEQKATTRHNEYACSYSRSHRFTEFSEGLHTSVPNIPH